MKFRGKVVAISFLIMALLSCVLPGIAEPVANLRQTETPYLSIEETSVQFTQTVVANLSCDKENSANRGKIVASPNGGLNIRTAPLELGGSIIATIPDGELVDILIWNTGDGWAKVKWKGICGYSKNTYIVVEQKDSSQ